MEADIFVTEGLKAFIQRASEHGGNVYIVGGYVRNALLGYTGSDIDIAGTLTPSEVVEVCETLGYYSSIISKNMGTVLIKYKDEQYEYTTFRTEEYGEGGHHVPTKVTFITNMEQDSKRRDFTVNAFYYNPLTNQVFDLNNGTEDIKNRVLRCIGSPQQVFENDGLRILRFVRFACELDFKFDKLSYAAAKQKVNNLSDISKLRMLKELKSILTSDSKYGTYHMQQARCIQVMNDLGLYRYLFNSSFATFKIATRGRMWKAYLKTTYHNRYFIFLVLVLFQYLHQKQTNVAGVHYAVHTLLGNKGLKESKENINKMINLYLFFQIFWFLKPVSNDLCLKFDQLGDVTKQFFENLNAKKVALIRVRTQNLKNSQIPFVVGDVNITEEELVKGGIQPVYASKIKVVLFNECLNEDLKNEKSALMEHALLVQKTLLKQKDVEDN